MIKLIVFDLDGVLVDSRELHFISLNRALAEVDARFVISHEEHLAKYDGLPTKSKLQILTNEKDFPLEYHEKIKLRKQKITIELIEESVAEDQKLINLFRRLKKDGFTVYVASNAVRETIVTILNRKGIIGDIGRIFSNEEVKHSKPNPEIYLRCMIEAGVGPKETLIVEDSYIGRTAVFNSTAHLCPVSNPDELTQERLYSAMHNIDSHQVPDKWPGNNMNILIPMAGAGSRFAQAGYTFPKPLIEVRGKPMIQVVVENLGVAGRYTYVVQKSHFEKYNLKYLLNMITPDCNIVQVEGVTEGAACTTLLAKEFINNSEPLLIANSDQFVEWTPGEFYHSMNSVGVDGGILTFENTHPKWSYVKLSDSGNITQVAEKQVISNIATVGIYYWTKGSDYVSYAEKMIEQQLRVNNEFYVAPTYNLAIEDGAKIKPFKIPKMWGIGTPEDLNYFLQNYKGTI